MAAVLNDVFSVKVFCDAPLITAGRQGSLNVRHYKVIAQTGSGATELEVANAFDALWGPLYKTYLPFGGFYRGTVTQKIFPLPLMIAITVTTNFGIGTRGGTAATLLPPQTCGIITKQTLAAGRAFRGRTYMPFPDEMDNEAGVPNAGYLAALAPIAVAEAQAQIVGVIGSQSTLQPQIIRRTLPQAGVNVANGLVRPYWGTQRRRSTVYGPDTIIV